MSSVHNRSLNEEVKINKGFQAIFCSPETLGVFCEKGNKFYVSPVKRILSNKEAGWCSYFSKRKFCNSTLGKLEVIF